MSCAGDVCQAVVHATLGYVSTTMALIGVINTKEVVPLIGKANSHHENDVIH